MVNILNILITAAASVQAYILEKNLDQGQNIFFADSADLPEVMLQKKKFVKIPDAGSPSFAHEFLTCCLDLSVNVVFVLRKSELEVLAEARQLFDEYGIRLMIPLPAMLNDLTGNLKKGDLVIKGLNQNETQEGLIADRGVFLQSPDNPSGFQIYTAD